MWKSNYDEVIRLWSCCEWIPLIRSQASTFNTLIKSLNAQNLIRLRNENSSNKLPVHRKNLENKFWNFYLVNICRANVSLWKNDVRFAVSKRHGNLLGSLKMEEKGAQPLAEYYAIKGLKPRTLLKPFTRWVGVRKKSALYQKAILKGEWPRYNAPLIRAVSPLLDAEEN